MRVRGFTDGNSARRWVLAICSCTLWQSPYFQTTFPGVMIQQQTGSHAVGVVVHPVGVVQPQIVQAQIVQAQVVQPQIVQPQIVQAKVIQPSI